MATATSELNRALLNAGDAPDMLGALARVEYRKANPGEEEDCPGAWLPSVAEWVHWQAMSLGVGGELSVGMVEFGARHAECASMAGEAWKLIVEEFGALHASLQRTLRERGGERGWLDMREHPDLAAKMNEAMVFDPHRLWVAARARAAERAAEPPAHPWAALMREWLARPHDVEPWRPVRAASLPRFDKATVEDARLLAAAEQGAARAGQFELLHTDDVVDSCPTWLLAMFRRAVSVRTGRGLGSTRSGMPWSFTLVIGGLAHLSIPDRMMSPPQGRTLPFTIEDVIGWIHPERWQNRARDWSKLDEAFEETTSYRVTAGDGLRYWVVSAWGLPAVYSPEAPVKLVVRVPPSAAHGARFDWNRYHVTYAKRATLQRALLATAGYLDKTAHHGNPLTRRVREYELDDDGKPKRERVMGRDGKPKRDERGRYVTRPVYTGQIVPNPLLGELQPAFLPDKHVALFLGMADKRTNRHDGKAALETLHADRVIDLERVPNGYRIYGDSPREGE